jgi:hypothetical protein
VRGPERCGCCFAACRAPSTVRAPARGSATGLQRAREGMPHTSRRAGGVQTRGAFAVFGQLVMMRGSQTVLMKHNDGAQEGKHMREHIPGAEHGLQAVPVRSDKDWWPFARERRGSYCSVAYGIKT